MHLRAPRRTSFCCALLASAFAFSAAPAYAGFGVASGTFEAGTCSNRALVERCTYEEVRKDHAEAYTQSAGHPPLGVTSFELNHRTELLNEEPEGSIKRLRVDVPAGLAADPEALPQCSEAAFKADTCPLETQVGETKAVVWALLKRLELSGQVYNLKQPPGLPLLFGIHIGATGPIANEHLLLEGHVAWAGDYHEYFEINNISSSLPLLKSKLIFFGQAGQGNFLTLPTACSSTTVSHIEVESSSGERDTQSTETPVGVERCEADPFSPTTVLAAETSQYDQPDGVTVEVRVPQNVAAGEINTADIKDAHVTLPEGLTLNPSAAHGLEACTAAQIGIGGTAPVACPAGSKVGTVAIETDLPPGSLTGSVYLGSPGGGAITGPPYTIYIDAESELGVSVRLAGKVTPNPQTGRLETTFAGNPQLPFSSLALHFNGGPRAPLANPIGCGGGQVLSNFTPYTGLAASVSSTPFAAGGCPSPVPFSLGQSTQDSPSTGGAFSSYTFNLSRADGQQYLSQVKTVLPAGLVGMIPSVALCPEAPAQAGTCGASSQIGTASVNVGAGGEPYAFTGPVYLTGPYNGAPYGLSIPVLAAAGPFNLGSVVTRVAIAVDPHSARVIATASLPTIVGGVPLRLKSVSVAVNRPAFIVNPTSCAPLATDSLLGSTGAASDALSSPFQATGCNALPFKPSFAAATSSKTSKAAGASLQVNLTQGPHQANIHSVVASLPIQLPSRLTTLQKACPEATYTADPHKCPPESNVGNASATTPVLPGVLSGPAYLVSHGGAAFPDLDILLEDGLVRVILVGNTNIVKGITTSSFQSIPDVPVSSFQLTLPMGPHSALAGYGNLCAHTLYMPATITAQNGAVFKQNTPLAVSGCTVRIVRRRIVHHTLLITVQTFAPGRLVVSGNGLRTTSRRLKAAGTTTLRVKLTRKGSRTLAGRGRLKARVRVHFLPAAHGERASSASTTVRFRR